MLSLIISVTDRTLDRSVLVPARQEMAMVPETLELREIQCSGVSETGGFGRVAAVAVGGVDCEGWFGGEGGEEVKGGVVEVGG